MEATFKTSFIPKKPIVSDTRPVAPRISLFMLIALLLFIVSIGSAFAMFALQKKEAVRRDELAQELAQARESFDPTTLNTYIRLDSRLETGKTLLDKHAAFSPVFSLLEDNTVEAVRFKKFSLNYADQNAITLELSGQARSFTAVAQQSDIFSNNQYLRDITFSNLGLSQDGSVSFLVKARVLPDLFNYKKSRNIGAQASAAN